MGSSTENSAYFTTRNPWDLERVPGRLLGRLAAAVAADLAAASSRHRHRRARSGSRRPSAAWSGSSRPTAASRATAWSPSPPRSTRSGRFTQDVADAALRAPGDRGRRSAWTPPRLDVPVPDYLAALGRRRARGFASACRASTSSTGMDPEVEQAVRAAIERAGARSAPRPTTVSLPHTEYGLAAYYIIGARRGLLEPRPLRRRQVRAAGARPRPDRHVEQDPGRRLRTRGQAADHARAPTRSPPATTTPTTARRRRCARWWPATSRPRSRAWTLHRGAHHPGRRVQDRREGRPARRCI